MAQYQVTIDDEILQHLFVRDDGLARLVEQVVNQVLEAQATEQLKAKWYERTPDRQGYRNGHREKLLKTRVGEMIEMVINGVSTRKVRAIVEELCGTEFSGRAFRGCVRGWM